MQIKGVEIKDAIPLIIFSMGYVALISWLTIYFSKSIPSINAEYIFSLSLLPLVIIIVVLWRYKINIKLPKWEIYLSPVEDVMEKAYIINEEKTGRDAEELMEKNQIDFLNVVDENGKFVGIFTKGDALIARRKRKIGKKLKELMTPKEKVTSSFRGEKLIDAIHKIGKSKHSKLPVLDGENVIGIIDSVKILKYA